MKNLDKMKQYMHLVFMVLIDITIILMILDNPFGMNLFIGCAVAYAILGFAFRKVPELEEGVFKTRIDIVHKCATYSAYSLIAILMLLRWINR